MEERNPYAAPTAPLIAADEPTLLSTDPETFEYAGFWIRVGALLLDSLILSPLGILIFVLLNYTRTAYLLFAIPSIVLTLVYYVWLVKRFGGTPGKLMLRMRITMTDGSPVTTKAAFLRYSPPFILHVLSLVSMIQTTAALPADFETLGFIEKMESLGRSAPSWNNYISWLTYAWWIGAAITLAANRRRRAAHDFLAGTIVLRIG
jgi:uncharacterized RDD family membrane protein YckC